MRDTIGLNHKFCLPLVSPDAFVPDLGKYYVRKEIDELKETLLLFGKKKVSSGISFF